MRSLAQTCHVVIVAVVLAMPSYAAAQTDTEMNVPLSWKGVEIVTNDFDTVDRLRQAAALPPGIVLTLSDPKLRAACAAIRAVVPASEVRCMPVLGPTTGGGPATAWYNVEVDIKPRPQLACDAAAAPLNPELVGLLEQRQQAMWTHLLRAEALPEQVNDQKYLDYAAPDMSALAARLHAATKDRGSELAAAALSCDAGQRATSFYLMPFTGSPERFITLAGSRINDADAGAANAATRFLIHFAALVPAAELRGLQVEACKSAREGGFAERNKSLSLLNEWRKGGALSFAQLDAACQEQIRRIARTSVAGSIRVPARELVGKDGEKDYAPGP